MLLDRYWFALLQARPHCHTQNTPGKWGLSSTQGDAKTSDREGAYSWLRRHGNGAPVRLGTRLRVLAVDLDPHAFNHFRLFAVCLFVIVNEISVLADPGA